MIITMKTTRYKSNRERERNSIITENLNLNLNFFFSEQNKKKMEKKGWKKKRIFENVIFGSLNLNLKKKYVGVWII